MAQPGFLDFASEEMVGREPSAVTVRLVLRGPQVIIGASGGNVTAGVATLVFPAGAWDAGTAVSATFIGSSQLGSIPGPIQFISDAGTHHRVLGMISVEVARQPALPVEVRLPVPPTASGGFALFELTSGERFAATAVAGGFASFSLPHFSDYLFTNSSSSDYGFVVTDVSGPAELVTPQPSGPAVRTVVEGDLVPDGSSIRSSSNVSVRLESPSGLTCTGCCAEDDRCETGRLSSACGIEGTACEVCSAGTACDQNTRVCDSFSCQLTSSNPNPGNPCTATATCSDGRELAVSCGAPDPVDARSDCTCTTNMGGVTQTRSARIVDDCRSVEWAMICP